MKKILIFILGIIMFSSCTKQTSYKLDSIEYLGEEHNHLFMSSQPRYKYSITISKQGTHKGLIILTKRELNNIFAGDSVYLRNNDLILIK